MSVVSLFYSQMCPIQGSHGLVPFCPHPSSAWAISVPPLSQMDSSQLRMRETGVLKSSKSQDWNAFRRLWNTPRGRLAENSQPALLPRWRNVTVWTRRSHSFNARLPRPPARTMTTKSRNCKTGIWHNKSVLFGVKWQAGLWYDLSYL